MSSECYMVNGQHSKTHWSMIHDESITGNRSLRVLARVGDGKGYIETPVLFERDDEGLYISYYFTAQDALERKNKIGEICYGWDILMAEGDDAVRLAWYDLLVKHVSGEPLSCVHKGYTCNEMFHAAAVLLGNEEEDNCAVCAVWCGEEEE